MPDYIRNSILSAHEISESSDFEEIIRRVLSGDTALFVDGWGECLLTGTKGYEKRQVDSPKTENVVKGPHEAFCENLCTNITLIRRIVKNKRLVTEMIPVGTVIRFVRLFGLLMAVFLPGLFRDF